jgi:formate dehydrogenase
VQEVLAQRLRPLLERYGPHSIGIYFGNPIAFHTMGALSMLAFIRALGTRNVFTAGSQDCNNKFAGATLIHGSPLIHPVPDFAHTDLALMFGTNPAVSQASFVHLEGGSMVFDRMIERGARVIWVDPRRTESAQRWGEHVGIRPGTDIFLLLALLHALRDRYRPAPEVEGMETLLGLAADYPTARAAMLTGITPARIDDLADALRNARAATLHMSVGVNQGAFGTLCYVVLHALAYLSGNFDRGGGVLIHPLAVALAEIGRRVGVGTFTRHSRVDDFSSILFSLPGGILADEILTSGSGQIRALIVVGGDPVMSIPGTAKLQQALHQLEFLVSLDMFRNATSRESDLLLPMVSWLERWDVAMTTAVLQHAPLLQYAGPVQAVPGNVRSETRVLADISLALQRPLFGHAWLARLWGRMPWDTLLTGLCHSIRVLGQWRTRGVHGLPTPRPRPGRYLGRGPRTPGRRLRLWHELLAPEPQRLRDHVAELEAPTRISDSSGLHCVMICRRRRLGHNSWLHDAAHHGRVDHAVWLAPDDLARLGLPQGGDVVLETTGASLHVSAIPSPDVRCGLVVVPHGVPGMNVNALIPSGATMLEPLSGQHRMTGMPVRVRRAE